MTTPAGEVIHGKGFDAEVIRTNRRKTATLKIVEGKVSVVVPKSTSKDKVEALVNRKTRWIREKLLLQREHHHRSSRSTSAGSASPIWDEIIG